MKIQDAQFVISAVSPKQYPQEGLPEIALAGRSNVGKSSLINRLIARKNLARTSSKPGKTQTLNFYRINDAFHFVDLPGYGYAKVSKKMRAEWGKMIERYLLRRENLKLVIQIVDIRHQPTEDDQLMYNWLKHFALPLMVVATKSDKIPKGKIQKHLKTVRQTLEMDKHDLLIPFSAEYGTGKDEVWEAILAHLELPEEL